MRILTLACIVPLLAAINNPVKVEGGLVAGVPGKDPSISAFKGIPFGAPAAGENRWRAPQPVVPWQGVRSADKFGASCMQAIIHVRPPWTHEFMAHNEVSEDCLSLNVWSAAKSPTERRPVFVYIYGGGFNEGSSSIPSYDGEGLAAKGLVVVTLNYRVGVLGFLVHPELSKESGRNASGNYALLDQLAALQWVQKNIAVFGGDPQRVTIAGQSAGARSVHLLTASALAKGLFHRAIAQSGSSVARAQGGGERALADAEADGLKFAELKGAKSLADLRKLTWQQLMAPVQGAPLFQAIVDGYFLTSPLREVFAAGKQNDVPTLTGCNKGEGGAVPHPTVTAEEFQKQARQRYGTLADEFLKLYPASTDEQARGAQNESSWDQARSSMYLWARQRASTAKTKAFTYFWDHPMPGPEIERYGAFHTSEVPYVLNTLYSSDRPFTAADRKIADILSSYWANFAANGDPNGTGLPVWPAAGDKPETMEVGDITAPVAVAGNAAKFRFFEAFFLK